MGNSLFQANSGGQDQGRTDIIWEMLCCVEDPVLGSLNEVVETVVSKKWNTPDHKHHGRTQGGRDPFGREAPKTIVSV